MTTVSWGEVFRGRSDTPSPTTTWRWAAGVGPAPSARSDPGASTEQVPSRARNLIALLEGLA